MIGGGEGAWGCVQKSFYRTDPIDILKPIFKLIVSHLAHCSDYTPLFNPLIRINSKRRAVDLNITEKV